MGRKARQQADQRADMRSGRFIGLPSVVHEHPAYRALPMWERAVLIELLATFNGYNNGHIVLSYKQLAERLSTTNQARIGRAIARLFQHGLIDIGAESVWQQRKAREYRLTFISTGRPPHTRPATNEYLHWKNDAEPVSAASPLSAEPVSATVQVPATKAPAAPMQKPQFPVRDASLAAEPVSVLISKPYGAPAEHPKNTAVSRVQNRTADFSSDLQTLRAWLHEAIARSGYGAAREIAREADIPEPALSRFRSGKGIPERYRLRLQEACGRRVPFNSLAA